MSQKAFCQTYERRLWGIFHRWNIGSIETRYTYVSILTHSKCLTAYIILKISFSARTTNRFRDHSDKDRSAIHCSWHPDGGRSLAVAHANLGFQSDSSITESYVWNVENSNKPENILRPPSMALCLEYNPKDSHVILAGLHSGQVT